MYVIDMKNVNTIIYYIVHMLMALDILTMQTYITGSLTVSQHISRVGGTITISGPRLAVCIVVPTIC